MTVNSNVKFKEQPQDINSSVEYFWKVRVLDKDGNKHILRFFIVEEKIGLLGECKIEEKGKKLKSRYP